MTRYVYVVLFQGVVERVFTKPEQARKFKKKYGPDPDIEVHKRPLE